MPAAMKWWAAWAMAAILAPGTITHAAQMVPSVAEPQVNLGQTSFLDGEGGPGGLLEIIDDGTTAGYFTNPNGQAVPGRNELWSGSVTIHPALTCPPRSEPPVM